MNKNQFALLSLLVILLASSTLKQEEKMDLLFIITDQQCYDALSIAENTVVETPNPDKLAEQGAHFKNVCTPCAP